MQPSGLLGGCLVVLQSISEYFRVYTKKVVEPSSTKYQTSSLPEFEVCPSKLFSKLRQTLAHLRDSEQTHSSEWCFKNQKGVLLFEINNKQRGRHGEKARLLALTGIKKKL